MVDVAQLVRASDCGSEGRGFETHLPPSKQKERTYSEYVRSFCFEDLAMSHSVDLLSFTKSVSDLVSTYRQNYRQIKNVYVKNIPVITYYDGNIFKSCVFLFAVNVYKFKKFVELLFRLEITDIENGILFREADVTSFVAFVIVDSFYVGYFERLVFDLTVGDNLVGHFVSVNRYSGIVTHEHIRFHDFCDSYACYHQSDNHRYCGECFMGYYLNVSDVYSKRVYRRYDNQNHTEKKARHTTCYGAFGCVFE